METSLRIITTTIILLWSIQTYKCTEGFKPGKRKATRKVFPHLGDKGTNSSVTSDGLRDFQAPRDCCEGSFKLSGHRASRRFKNLEISRNQFSSARNQRDRNSQRYQASAQTSFTIVSPLLMLSKTQTTTFLLSLPTIVLYFHYLRGMAKAEAKNY
jgi:hypothetical protein